MLYKLQAGHMLVSSREAPAPEAPAPEAPIAPETPEAVVGADQSEIREHNESNDVGIHVKPG